MLTKKDLQFLFDCELVDFCYIDRLSDGWQLSFTFTRLGLPVTETIMTSKCVSRLFKSLDSVVFFLDSMKFDKELFEIRVTI